MPAFDTPEPISGTLEFGSGSASITASERTDTVVRVEPVDADDDRDVAAAQQTSVSCANGRLLVKGPKSRLFGRSGSIQIHVELPTESDIQATSPLADFTCSGRLGDCRVTTSLGHIRLAEAATALVKTQHGDIGVDHVAGDAEVTGAGRIDVGEVQGTATIKNVNGETVLGEVIGDLRVRASNGRIFVARAHSEVDARSANGGIRVDQVARGRIILQTSIGDLEVGIREGVPAWLDLHSGAGKVHNSLDHSQEGSADREDSLEVRARTNMGDIVIRRA